MELSCCELKPDQEWLPTFDTNVGKNIPKSTICEDDLSVVNTVHPQYSTLHEII